MIPDYENRNQTVCKYNKMCLVFELHHCGSRLLELNNNQNNEGFKKIEI